MIVVLSPAKSLNLEAKNPFQELISTPVFQNEANELAKKLTQKSATDLAEMMHISEQLSTLNAERYQNWNYGGHSHNKHVAIYTFDGDVYTGFDAKTLSQLDMETAQKQIRILSGIFGILKPMDLMQPYRLEMGTKWQVSETEKNLYQFWGDKIANQLHEEFEQIEGEPLLVNLASKEYFRAVNKKVLNADIVDITFKDFKNGKLKVISFFAKKARGAMARYIVTSKAKTIDDLKQFNGLDYQFNKELSSEKELVFTR